MDAELRSLRSALKAAHEKETEMTRLRDMYRGHYRTKYGYMKPHDPSAVLGDNWDVHPNVMADLATPEKEGSELEQPSPSEESHHTIHHPSPAGDCSYHTAAGLLNQ